MLKHIILFDSFCWEFQDGYHEYMHFYPILNRTPLADQTLLYEAMWWYHMSILSTECPAMIRKNMINTSYWEKGNKINLVTFDQEEIFCLTVFGWKGYISKAIVRGKMVSINNNKQDWYFKLQQFIKKLNKTLNISHKQYSILKQQKIIYQQKLQ